MPKKPQVSREEILRTALELVRSGGDGVLNARALAKALGCSTQPIFRNFTDMQALRAALLEEIHNRYLAFVGAYARCPEPLARDGLYALGRLNQALDRLWPGPVLGQLHAFGRMGEIR